MKQQAKIWMGFDILTEAKHTFKPRLIHVWGDKEYSSNKPEKPLHYKTDALLGLSLFNINPKLTKADSEFTKIAWQSLEPHWELYQSTQERVASIKGKTQAADSKWAASFETNFNEVISSSMTEKGLNLNKFIELIDEIDRFEAQLKSPLIYNFTINFSDEFTDKLHFLYSFLFNLRALVGVDHNAHIIDSVHECVTVDSITDYVPKAEYVTNDAMIFYSFMKQLKKSGRQMDAELDLAFKKYTHNGVCLIRNLPKDFLAELTQAELEEALYLVQMDWLLGTEAGLLFRIREELFGLKSGYDKVFWTHAVARKNSMPARLTVNCQLSEKDLPVTDAA